MARTTPPSRPFVLGFACGRSALTATPHTRLPKPGHHYLKTDSTHPEQLLDRPRPVMDDYAEEVADEIPRRRHGAEWYLVCCLKTVGRGDDLCRT